MENEKVEYLINMINDMDIKTSNMYESKQMVRTYI